MTSYAILAEALTKAGVKNASPTKARELAEREFRGQPLTDLERQVFDSWAALAWMPETRNVKKPGEER